MGKDVITCNFELRVSSYRNGLILACPLHATSASYCTCSLSLCTSTGISVTLNLQRPSNLTSRALHRDAEVCCIHLQLLDKSHLELCLVVLLLASHSRFAPLNSKPTTTTFKDVMIGRSFLHGNICAKVRYVSDFWLPAYRAFSYPNPAFKFVREHN